MIPYRCYSDIHKLLDSLRFYDPECSHASDVIESIMQDLKLTLARWEDSDDNELSAMADEYEKSEKDCMWERE